MKKKTIFFALLTVVIFSCQKDLCLTDSPNESLAPTLLTKSLVPPHETPYFDWEDTTHVFIAHYQYVMLPWITGATGDIPSYVRSDYHRNKGWELVYNICSDPIINENGHKNYLIFYNRITGILRIFYYKREVSQSIASNSFAHLSSTSSSRLWDFNQGMFSALQGESTQGAYVPNRTNSVESRTLCTGWNCFEIELAYDDSENSYDNSFSIALLDHISFDFHLKGVMAGNAFGSLAFPATSTSGTPSIQQWATAAKETLGSINQIIGATASGHTSQPPTKVDVSAIITIASAAISIVNSVYGLFKRNASGSSGNVTATDNITISMDAFVNTSGSIETMAPAQAASIAFLPLPGSGVNEHDIVVPHYNKNLGAWNVTSGPTVYIDQEYTPRVYEVLSGPSWSRQYGVNYERCHTLGGVSVSVNPETLQFIDSYDYSVTYYYLYKYDGTYFGRTLTGIDATNLLCSDPGQYLKKCFYEEPLSNFECQELAHELSVLKGTTVTVANLSEEQKLRTIVYKVDMSSADMIIDDPNSFCISVPNNYNYEQTRTVIRNSVSYPQAQTVCEDYIAKVQMIFHIKEEYGGGEFASVKTFRPSYVFRNVVHNVDNFLPYYQRPQKETDYDRWLHRWDWVL